MADEKLTEEVWKAIPDCRYYEASNLGQIRSVDHWITDKLGKRRFLRGRILKHGIGKKSPYHRVAVGLGTQRLVHLLVLLAFVGKPPKWKQGCHNNGNLHDNRLENLRYDTAVNNHADRVKHGTMLRGARNPGAKLTPEQVADIRSSSLPPYQLAKKYSVSKQTINNILYEKTWRSTIHATNPNTPT